MTPTDAKKRFLELASQNNGRVDFYGYMYGYAGPNEKILDMTVRKDALSKDGKSFFYFWGYPGPDYNQYSFSDYGKTWAFTMEDFQ